MAIHKHEFRTGNLRPCLEELSRVTSNPSEGAIACLCMFVFLWQQQNPDQSLQSIADSARRMIMSYEDLPTEPLQ